MTWPGGGEGLGSGWRVAGAQSTLSDQEPSPCVRLWCPVPAPAAAQLASLRSAFLDESDLHTQALAVRSECLHASLNLSAGSGAGDPFAVPFARSSLLLFPGELQAWPLPTLSSLHTPHPVPDKK